MQCSRGDWCGQQQGGKQLSLPCQTEQLVPHKAFSRRQAEYFRETPTVAAVGATKQAVTCPGVCRFSSRTSNGGCNQCCTASSDLITADGYVVPSQAEQCAAGSDIFEDEQQGSSGLGEPLSSQTKSRLRFAASSDF